MDVEFFREGEILVNGGIARGQPLILEANVAHDLAASGGEFFAEFIDRYALSGMEAIRERRAGNDAGGGGMAPFLNTLWISEDDGGDVEAIHFGQDVFHVFAGSGGIESGRAIFLHPSE